jgi:hypothetical protein
LRANPTSQGRDYQGAEMTTAEQYITKELTAKLSGHLPESDIKAHSCQMVLYYKKWGMKQAGTPIVESFYKSAKKTYKSKWIN